MPRYLVKFSDGGAGPRRFAEPLVEGQTIREGGAEYRVREVRQPTSEAAMGFATVVLVEANADRASEAV